MRLRVPNGPLLAWVGSPCLGFKSPHVSSHVQQSLPSHQKKHAQMELVHVAGLAASVALDRLVRVDFPTCLKGCKTSIMYTYTHIHVCTYIHMLHICIHAYMYEQFQLCRTFRTPKHDKPTQRNASPGAQLLEAVCSSHAPRMFQEP